MSEDPFFRAMQQSMDDHELYGDIDSGDWIENGAMRAVGISRSDSLRLTAQFFELHAKGLAKGWVCPECGKTRDDNGDCPDGHEFDKGTAESDRFSILLAVIEQALSIGVHLERNRWESTTTTGGTDGPA